MKLDNVRVNGDVVTERTIKNLEAFFESNNHSPSEDHWRGIRHIAKVIEYMANGSLASNFYISFLPPGMGKTSTLVETVKELGNSDYKDQGVIIFLFRLEEIDTLVGRMGLAETDYSVITSDPVLNAKGNQHKDRARVLFTTQQQLEVRSRTGTRYTDIKAFYYRGKPRSVKIWDEATSPSVTITLNIFDLSDMWGTLHRNGLAELKTELEALYAQLGTTLTGNFVQIPDIEKYNVGVDEAMSWFNDDKKHAVEALWSLSGRTCRVRKDQYGNNALDYDDLLPDDLAPMLILDASGGLRNTYKLWFKGRRNLEFLHSPQKSYEGLTIHHWDRGAGKQSQTKDFESIVDGVVRTINETIPTAEEVLVIHFKKSKYIKDYETEIRKRIVDNPERVKFCNWGRHTATNDYRDIKYVILAGVMQYNTAQYEAAGRGAKGIAKDEELSEDEYNQTRLGEVAHHVLQAACRGYVRNAVAGKCPEGCHLYIIFSTSERTGLPQSILNWIFPDANIENWKPIIRLKGKALTLADMLVAEARDGTNWRFKKSDFMAKLGLKQQQEIDRLLKHKDFMDYLAQQWVIMAHGKGEIMVGFNTR